MRSIWYSLLLVAIVFWYTSREYTVPMAAASHVASDFNEDVGFKSIRNRDSVALPQIAPNPALVAITPVRPQRDRTLPKSVRDLISNLTVFNQMKFPDTNATGYVYKDRKYKPLRIFHGESVLALKQGTFSLAYKLNESSKNIFTYNNDPYSIVIRDTNRIIYLKMFTLTAGKIGYYGWLIHSPYSNPKVSSLATLTVEASRAPANKKASDLTRFFQPLPEI